MSPSTIPSQDRIMKGVRYPASPYYLGHRFSLPSPTDNPIREQWRVMSQYAYLDRPEIIMILLILYHSPTVTSSGRYQNRTKLIIGLRINKPHIED